MVQPEESVILRCSSRSGKARTSSALPRRKNHEMLYKLGSDELIDYTTQRFADVTRNIDVVLDTIGGDTQERSWQVLKKGGILVSFVQSPSENKAKEHGVRGIRLGARPNGQELVEIAKIV